MLLENFFENFELLTDAPNSVPKLRELILQLAVMGKLIRQNEQNEPASVLFEKIKADKERLIKEKKIKQDKPLPDVIAEEMPFEIPYNWQWVRLGELGYTQTGTTPSK